MSAFIYIVYLIGCFFFGGEPNVEVVLPNVDAVLPNVVAQQDLTSLPSTEVTTEVSNSISEPTKDPIKFSFDWRAFENNNRLYRLNMERMSRSMEIQRQIRARDNLLNEANQRFR